jgi:hypothetical protein
MSTAAAVNGVFAADIKDGNRMVAAASNAAAQLITTTSIAAAAID